jgi:hypothetical protein
MFTWQLQVVELKVGMHCDRCIKSIKKAIKTIDGREAFDQLSTKQPLSALAYYNEQGFLFTYVQIWRVTSLRRRRTRSR